MKGTTEDHQVQPPCRGQGHLGQVTQEDIVMGLERSKARVDAKGKEKQDLQGKEKALFSLEKETCCIFLKLKGCHPEDRD